MKLGFTRLLHLPLQQQNIEHGCCRFTHWQFLQLVGVSVCCCALHPHFEYWIPSIPNNMPGLRNKALRSLISRLNPAEFLLSGGFKVGYATRPQYSINHETRRQPKKTEYSSGHRDLSCTPDAVWAFLTYESISCPDINLPSASTKNFTRVSSSTLPKSFLFSVNTQNATNL